MATFDHVQKSTAQEGIQPVHDPDRVTLITGAAAGIGAELARVFASKRHRLALVDRRVDRLTTMAIEIVAAGGTAPILIPCDLEHSDACDKIAANLATEGVEVEFVVNNAGFGLFGNAIELDREAQLGIIAVNIRALTDLSLRFSDSLIQRRGGILNAGSLVGLVPAQGWRCIMHPRRLSSVSRNARYLDCVVAFMLRPRHVTVFNDEQGDVR